MTAGEDPGSDSAMDEHLLQSINAVLGAVRRENGRETLGAKAIRTRELLLKAAADEFREKGYLATSTLEIAERAGVSLATFYQYFTDLSGIVAVLTGEHAIEMLKAHVDEWDPRGGQENLRRMVSVYVRGYLDNAEFYRLYEEAIAVDPRIAGIRRDLWAAYRRRIERSLRLGVEAGAVRDDLPLTEVARTLTHLIDRHCHDIAVRNPGRDGPSADAAIDLVTALWADCVRLAEPV